MPLDHPVLVPIVAIAAYLLGSLSFAVLVSRSFGLADPRTYGSGNPGATNVLRSGSKPAAIATLLLDALKGALPILVVARFGEPYGLGEGTQALVGLAAFAGHLWPVFFGFKGGKGVATAAGVLLALNPWLGLAALASFGLIVFFFRYVSLASIVAAAFAPFYQVLIWGMSPMVPAIAVMSLLLVWRHAPNIRKLMNGTESKLGQKAATPATATAPTPATTDGTTPRRST